MDEDYDVVEMDFPPYEEEYSHLPEPESTAEPFYKVKEEVYRRNRAIAAEEQTALLKAEERRKAEKRERYREMLEEAKPVKRRGLSGKEKLIPWIIVVVGIVSSLHRVGNSKPDTDGVYVTSAQPVQVLQTTAVELVTRAEAEENAFDELKLGIVREPFANDGVSYVYCTSAMSYKFTPSYDEQIPGMVKINVTVKNLTDFPYMVMSEFYYGNENGEKIPKLGIHDYDPNNAFSSGGADSAPEAFAFDENHICSFSILYSSRALGGDDDEVYLYSTPKNVSEQFVQYADEDFQIPIRSILKYLT